MVRKMALIPADMASYYAQQQHLPSAPILKEMSSLDNQMKDILNNPGMPPELKYKQYFNALQRYDAIHENAYNQHSAPQPPPPDIPWRKPEKQLPVGEEELLQQIPKPQQRGAKLLVNYIKNNPDLSWNEAKELVYKGNRIPHSNIYDLISNASRNRKHAASPRGWRQFTNALIDQNVPEGAIGNVKLWQHIRDHGESQDEAPRRTPLPGSSARTLFHSPDATFGLEEESAEDYEEETPKRRGQKKRGRRLGDLSFGKSRVKDQTGRGKKIAWERLY